MVLLSFFFFKQKTAYELRISDWSSDVCSSDLTSTWARAAISGTTPPKGRCASSCPAMRCANMRRSVATSAAAVSSQLDSRPNMIAEDDMAAFLPAELHLEQVQ